MVQRSGKYGPFWGCSGYPKCKGILSGAQVQKAALEQRKAAYDAAPKKKFTPSRFQLAVYNFVEHGTGNGAVKAVAGSGKTTTNVSSLSYVGRGLSVVFCAFNRHIRDDIKVKAPPTVNVKTIHQMGFGACRKAAGRVMVDSDSKKVWGIVDSIFDGQTEFMKYPAKKLVGLVKNTLADPEDSNAMLELIDRYDIDCADPSEEMETDEAEEKVAESIPEIIARNNEDLSLIDFDDMVYLPIALGWEGYLDKHDWVFVDEAQDLNTPQTQIILASMKHNGRAMVIGDPKQSIYGFRGADMNAMPYLMDQLKAEELPLTITYRCPRSHVALAQEIVPYIEAAPDAKEGSVEWVQRSVLSAAVADGDLVICRVNAPLVKLYYEVVSQNKKAIMRGRDMGEGLIALIKRMKAESIPALREKLEDFESREGERLARRNRVGAIQSLRDKIACIEVFMVQAETIDQLIDNIRRIFDDDSKTGVILSSVHRAKGDEANNVFILRPELMPHPLARQEWQLEQEMNLKYVALTRSKDFLGFVEGDRD